jgi:hypothetical protein
MDLEEAPVGAEHTRMRYMRKFLSSVAFRSAADAPVTMIATEV